MKTIFTSLLLLCAIAINAQFANYYDPANWTTTHSSGCDNGYVDATGAPGSVLIVGSENPGCFSSVVAYGVTVAICGTVSFDWLYTTDDCDGSFFDPFGYYLNGVPTQLSVDGHPDGSSQSGSVSISVNVGDVVAFYVWSRDNICGRAWSTISNFSGPDAVCFGDEGEVKVELCHNGRSICVSPNAVPAHLAHGDQYGDCYEAGGCDDGEEMQDGGALANRSVSTFTPSSNQMKEIFGDEAGFEVISIAPNPSKDVVNLTVNRGVEGPAVVTVYNLNGQRMLQADVNITKGVPVQVNVSKLIAGSYTISLESTEGFKMNKNLTIGSK